MNYLKLLEHSYKIELQTHKISRYEFLAENIFNFTIYDGGMADQFGRRSLEVCQAINTQQTFEYQKKGPANYLWYLVMVNMPFFADRLEWGSSIRGAWWSIHGDIKFVVNSCGLWRNTEQLLELQLDAAQWTLFIQAMYDFTTVK